MAIAGGWQFKRAPLQFRCLLQTRACWLLGKKSRAQEAGRRLELLVIFHAGHASTQRACRLEQFGLINGSIHSYPASSINAFWPPRATLRHSYTAKTVH
jgi:hypothetical protein